MQQDPWRIVIEVHHDETAVAYVEEVISEWEPDRPVRVDACDGIVRFIIMYPTYTDAWSSRPSLAHRVHEHSPRSCKIFLQEGISSNA